MSDNGRGLERKLTVPYPSSILGRQISGTNCTARTARAGTVRIDLEGPLDHYPFADVSVWKNYEGNLVFQVMCLWLVHESHELVAKIT